MLEICPMDAEMDGLADALLGIAGSCAKTADLYAVFGEYCHVLRNRLNCLKLSLYLARRAAEGDPNEPWTELEQQYLVLESFIERFQTICRPMRLTPIRVALGMLIEERAAAWTARFEPRRVRLDLRPPRKPAVGVFDPLRLGQGLDTLAAWRADAAAPDSTVQLAWWATDRRIALDWHEPKATKTIVDDAARRRPPTLALPLLARIVASHGGTCGMSHDDGLRVSLSWPLDATAT